jgi:hypothetical protein
MTGKVQEHVIEAGLAQPPAVMRQRTVSAANFRFLRNDRCDALDQLVDRHGLVGVDHHGGQHTLLPGRSYVDRLAVETNPEVAEHTERAAVIAHSITSPSAYNGCVAS